MKNKIVKMFIVFSAAISVAATGTLPALAFSDAGGAAQKADEKYSTVNYSSSIPSSGISVNTFTKAAKKKKITIKQTGAHKVKVKWKAAKKVKKYKVFKKKGKGKWGLVKTTKKKKITANKLKTGKTYTFKVVGIFKDGSKKKLGTKKITIKTWGSRAEMVEQATAVRGQETANQVGAEMATLETMAQAEVALMTAEAEITVQETAAPAVTIASLKDSIPALLQSATKK